MTESFQSKEASSPHPGELAALLRKNRTQRLGHTVAIQEKPVTVQPEEKGDALDHSPVIGEEFIDEDGRCLLFAPIYKHIRNPRTGQYDRKQYSLRDYFSHTAADGANGPGWDMRMGLLQLSDKEMTARYGHVFTKEEVMSPQNMPDNVPYYSVVSKEEYQELAEHGLL